MRPSSRDVRVRVLTTGKELDALHELTPVLSESYDLNPLLTRPHSGRSPVA